MRCVMLKSEVKFKKAAKNLAVSTSCINTHRIPLQFLI